MYRRTYVCVFVYVRVYFSGSIPSYRHNGTFKKDPDYKSVQSKMTLMKSCKSTYEYFLEYYILWQMTITYCFLCLM